MTRLTADTARAALEKDLAETSPEQFTARLEKATPKWAKPRLKRASKQPLHEVLHELAEMSRRPSMCSEVSRRLLELAAAMEAGK